MLALRENPAAEVDEEDDRFISAFLLESPQQISAAYRPYEPRREEDDEDDDSSGDDFEFALTDPDTGLSVTADEIFSDGRILPIYPVFNRGLLAGGRVSIAEEEKEVTLPLRRLLIEERGKSPSDPDELEGLQPGTYCVWVPRSSPRTLELWRKTNSTGSSSSRRWHLRDLVSNRSHSDGKEKFVFLQRAPSEKKRSCGRNPNPNPKAGLAEEVKISEKGKSGNGTKGGRATEMDMVTAHRLYYDRSSSHKVGSATAVKTSEKGKSGNGTKGSRATEMDMVTAHRLYYDRSSNQGVKGGRRSYLPYKQELMVGFFAPRNGLSRSHNSSSYN